MAIRWRLFALPHKSAAAAGAPSETTVRQHLSRILASPEFSSAARLQQFLTFIVEERLAGVDTIKETEVAIRVFHRQPSFDSSGDSIVRVAATNLRSRLRDYYGGTGLHDPLVIHLPKGSYVPVFQPRDASPQPVRRPSLLPLAAGLLLTAILAGLWLYGRDRRPPAVPSIAVLPFLNLSADPAQEHLADGFVDEITTALAQVEALHVAARSSAFQFRGQNVDARAAGRQLGVDALLEGSLRADHGRIYVNAQLINTHDGFHVWSHLWETDAAGLFTIQADLTRAVAEALHRKGPTHLTEPRNLAAYDLYLKGQYFKDRITAADVDKAIDLLQQSVSLDPTYAPAHAALADAYATSAYYQASPDPALIAKAKAEVQNALRLDPRQATAKALLAWILFFYDWDWAASERGFREALELNPNSARAREWHAQELLTSSHFTEAAAEAARAASLDPLNCRALTSLSVTLYCARRYDEAIHQSRLALELNPHFYKAHAMIGVSLQEKGMLAEAETELQAALAENPTDPDTIVHLLAVSRLLGKSPQAARLLTTLEAIHPRPNYELALAQLIRGQTAPAFDLLEQAVAQRSSDVAYLNVDPVFDPLRTDPRYGRISTRLHWTY